MRAFFALLLGALLPFAAKAQGKQALLFCYFVGNGEDGLHLARSEDGLSWWTLRSGASFLKPEVGEDKLMRDPCILLGPDGVFRMVWTTAWWGHTIGYASSRDLIHWSPEMAIPVMAREPTAVNCWAPEVIYDANKGHYLIFWATTIPGRFPATDQYERSSTGQRMLNHRIYSTTTRDFVTFTPTRLHYDGGFDVIDATMDQNGPEWLLIVKNETISPHPEKNIRVIHAKTPDGPFSAPSPPINGHYWAEGPTAIRIDGWWYVYFDRYREHRFGVARSRDLVRWEDLSDRLVMPAGIKHGTVFRAPEAVADALE